MNLPSMPSSMSSVPSSPPMTHSGSYVIRNQTSSTTVHLNIHNFCTMVRSTSSHRAVVNQTTGTVGSSSSVCVVIHVFVAVLCAALTLMKSFKSSVNCGLRIYSPTWKKSVMPGFRSHARNQRQEHISSHIPAQHFRTALLAKPLDIGAYFRRSTPAATSLPIPAAS